MGYPTDDDFREAHGWNSNPPKLAIKITRKRKKKKVGRLEISEGIYDCNLDGQGGIVRGVNLQSGNQEENCWIFEAPKKFHLKKVRLFMEIIK